MGSATSYRHLTDRVRLNKKRLFNSFTTLVINSAKHAILFKKIMLFIAGVIRKAKKALTENLSWGIHVPEELNNVPHKMSDSHYKYLEDFITTAIYRKWLTSNN